MRKILVLFLALGACSGGGRDDGSDGGVTPASTMTAVDSYVTRLATEACAWEFRCCKDAEIKVQDGRKFADQAACVPYRALALRDQLYLERLAVLEGRLKLDDARASACVSQMQGQLCSGHEHTTPAPVDPMATMDHCLHVFVGATPIGRECVFADECVVGGHCVLDKAAVGRGVCVPFQKENEICNGDGDCDPDVAGLYCAKQDFKCHQRAKLGQPCAYTGTTPLSATLPLLLECDNRIGNAYCDPATSTCRQLPADGEPCLSPLPPGVTSSCDPDPTLALTCVAGSTTTTGRGTCRAPARVGEDCSSRACGKELYCDRSGASTGTAAVCRALPTLGEPCQPSQYVCKMPYYCNYSATPYVCDQPARVNEDCTRRTCDTGLYCDSGTGTGGSGLCRPRLDDGQVCTASAQCLSSLCGGNMSPQTCQPGTVAVVCSGR